MPDKLTTAGLDAAGQKLQTVLDDGQKRMSEGDYQKLAGLLDESASRFKKANGAAATARAAELARLRARDEYEASKARPATAAVQGAPVVPVAETGKRWTPDKLAELSAYRDSHTMPETAAKFGISEQRIRRLLPSKKPRPAPFAGLIHRMK